MKYFRIKDKRDIDYYLSYPSRLVLPHEKVFLDFHPMMDAPESKDQILNKVLEEGTFFST